VYKLAITVAQKRKGRPVQKLVSEHFITREKVKNNSNRYFSHFTTAWHPLIGAWQPPPKNMPKSLPLIILAQKFVAISLNEDLFYPQLLRKQKLLLGGPGAASGKCNLLQSATECSVGSTIKAADVTPPLPGWHVILRVRLVWCHWFTCGTVFRVGEVCECTQGSPSIELDILKPNLNDQF
jgi:hypothetical protein